MGFKVNSTLGTTGCPRDRVRDCTADCIRECTDAGTVGALIMSLRSTSDPTAGFTHWFSPLLTISLKTWFAFSPLGVAAVA